MNSSKFRKELVKIMPGYSWTVHRNTYSDPQKHLSATGIQSSGFNRLSTVEVSRNENDGVVRYTVRSAGFGKRAPWLSECERSTLAQAFRGLQDHYEARASEYSAHAAYLESARKKHNKALVRDAETATRHTA